MGLITEEIVKALLGFVQRIIEGINPSSDEHPPPPHNENDKAESKALGTQSSST